LPKQPGNRLCGTLAAYPPCPSIFKTIITILHLMRTISQKPCSNEVPSTAIPFAPVAFYFHDHSSWWLLYFWVVPNFFFHVVSQAPVVSANSQYIRPPEGCGLQIKVGGRGRMACTLGYSHLVLCGKPSVFGGFPDKSLFRHNRQSPIVPSTTPQNGESVTITSIPSVPTHRP
jgi:hypothetical protein